MTASYPTINRPPVGNRNNWPLTPLTSELRCDLAPGLQPPGDQLAELRHRGRPARQPSVSCLPVVPEIVVEILTDQDRPESGRYRRRPRTTRVRAGPTPNC
ncbi:hypothetical protein GCM10010502_63760 [Kitasatospora aureofaciens]|uniref:Restriction endonuclease domain-containing protein n=1 Tax=Kitasatospora aureofaciens TaxID=1894 RepID=A0A8H9LXE3_KITAU|nr:hypothetical protein GCM10010502_63760 [Kitasatospora aureofaciens]